MSAAAQQAPPLQADLFRSRLPRRAYATDNLEWGVSLIPRDAAAQKRYVQPNPPTQVTWLLFDVDRPDAALRWEDAGLPAPTWIARNPANGHAHLAYGLSAPVAKSDAARAAPLRFAAAIQSAYNARLGADLGYSGLIAKNPLHPSWEVQWFCRGEHDLYTLSDLADYVSLSGASRRRELPDSALGRNCTLFDRLRVWAYKAVRNYWRPGGFADWQAAVLAQAHARNTFATPLPLSEVRSVGRSVSKWVWGRFTPAEFRAMQGRRGRRKGAQVRAALLPLAVEARAQGRTLREIAAELGVSYQTVSNWLKEPGMKPTTAAERRLQAVRMQRAGASVAEIALTLSASKATVYRWLRSSTPDPVFLTCQKAISDSTAHGAGLGG